MNGIQPLASGQRTADLLDAVLIASQYDDLDLAARITVCHQVVD